MDDNSINEKEKTLEKIISELPKEDKEKVVAAIYAYERKSWSGPLPSPEDFEKYENIMPGSMNRVLTLMEKQADHRMDKENKELEAQIQQSKIGQIIGAVLVSLFGCFAFILGLLGHDSVATGLGVATAISLAAIFVLKQIPSWLKQKP